MFKKGEDMLINVYLVCVYKLIPSFNRLDFRKNITILNVLGRFQLSQEIDLYESPEIQ